MDNDISQRNKMAPVAAAALVMLGEEDPSAPPKPGPFPAKSATPKTHGEREKERRERKGEKRERE